MKILHICMTQYSDGWTYQENLLSKYHKMHGHEVSVITSMYCYNEGSLQEDKNKDFIDTNGVHIIRLEKKNKHLRKMPTYRDFYKTLCKEKPDIIFSHGCQYRDISLIVKYVKQHPNVKLYVDNHADYSNSATNFLSKVLLHGIVWKYYAKKTVPYVEKYWGVLPARVDFLKEMYKLPSDKCDLLVMGADAEFVKSSSEKEARYLVRKRYHIADDDFLIMTGGKIDSFKTQTLMLMDAVKNISNPKVKLVVFGSVTEEIKKDVEKRIVDNKIQFIGWIDSENSYKLFAAADLVVFPGRHSVFWEQVAGQGIPMLCKKWDGTNHIDIGGNVRFLTQDSAEEIQNDIEEIISKPDEYEKMKKVAVEIGMKVFSYDEISRKSIGNR